MSKNLIEITNLKKEYLYGDVRISVLEKVNLNITSGKLIALVGPSGSGKSTLLNLLALLDKPTSGSIKSFGVDVQKLTNAGKNKMIRENISIIFQNNNLLSDFTALENVAIPLIIRNENYKSSIEKASETGIILIPFITSLSNSETSLKFS